MITNSIKYAFYVLDKLAIIGYTYCTGDKQMNPRILPLEKLFEFMTKIAEDKNFDHNSEVFINCNDELAVTVCTADKGYQGYFLNFETGKIHYSD